MQLWRVCVTTAALVAARGPSLDEAAGQRRAQCRDRVCDHGAPSVDVRVSAVLCK